MIVKILITVLAMFSQLAAGIQAVGTANSIDIIGWPVEDIDGAMPPLWLGGDPLLGRMSCPALVRLNLSTLKVEGLILKSLETSRSVAGALTWKFVLKDGIYWWSGAPVGLADVGKFLESQLRSLVDVKSGGLWVVPPFRVEVGKDAVYVHWQSPPRFGPYLLVDSPFWQKSAVHEGGSGLPYECAGAYAAQPSAHGYLLVPSMKYGGNRSVIRVLVEKPGAPSAKWLEFQHANSLNSNPGRRAPDRPQPCRQRIDLPYMTVLEWNSARRVVSSAERRKLIASLIPKGALLRSGSGNLGDLISAPIPRRHPGYNNAIKVGKFSLGSAAELRAKLGISSVGSPAVKGASVMPTLELKIGTFERNPEIIEKVLTDSFKVAGLDLQMMPMEQNAKSEFDGVLYTAHLSGPEMNLLPNFHSMVKGSLHRRSPGGAELDKVLEDYLADMSQGEFNPLKLKEIHRRLDGLEFMTVLLHHSVCLVGSSNFDSNLGAIDTNNPDWFRQLLTKN